VNGLSTIRSATTEQNEAIINVGLLVAKHHRSKLNHFAGEFPFSRLDCSGYAHYRRMNWLILRGIAFGTVTGREQVFFSFRALPLLSYFASLYLCAHHDVDDHKWLLMKSPDGKFNISRIVRFECL